MNVFHGVTDHGFFYDANKYSAAEHGGTHIDAPIHFAKGKHTADEIPVERLIGPAVVIDVSEKALPNPDYLVPVSKTLQLGKQKMARLLMDQ